MRRWLTGLVVVLMILGAARGWNAMRARGWVRWPPSTRGLGGAFLILGSMFNPSIVDQMNAEQTESRVFESEDDEGQTPPGSCS